MSLKAVVPNLEHLHAAEVRRRADQIGVPLLSSGKIRLVQPVRKHQIGAHAAQVHHRGVRVQVDKSRHAQAAVPVDRFVGG
jgi:hypothetical protein